MKTHFLLLIVLILTSSFEAAADFNLRTSPLSMLIGLWNVRADMDINDNWMTGLQVSYFNRTIERVDQKSQGLGISATYYPDGVFVEGPYFDVELATSMQKASTEDALNRSVTVDFSNHSLRALAGYQWFWMPLSLNLGAGLNMNSAGKVRIRDISGNEVDSVDLKPVGLALDFTVGLVF